MSVLILVFIASLLLNGLLGWYVYRLLRRYYPLSEDIEDLHDTLEKYHFHIKTVSEMESFYGDDIILNLLRHSKAISSEVKDFRKAYSLAEAADFDEDGELNGEEEGTEGSEGKEEKDDPSEEDKALQRKVIFHQG